MGVYIVVGVIFLLAISRAITSVSKSAQKIQGHNRCEFCGARLKTAPRKVGYAPACAHCGHVQSWTRR